MTASHWSLQLTLKVQGGQWHVVTCGGLRCSSGLHSQTARLPSCPPAGDVHMVLGTSLGTSPARHQACHDLLTTNMYSLKWDDRYHFKSVWIVFMADQCGHCKIYSRIVMLFMFLVQESIASMTAFTTLATRAPEDGLVCGWELLLADESMSGFPGIRM